MSSPTWPGQRVVIADRARRPDRDHRLPAGEPTSARRAHRPRRVGHRGEGLRPVCRHGVALVARSTAGSPECASTVSWSQLRRLPAPVLTVVPVHRQTAASVRSARSATADVVGFNRDLVALVRQSRAGMIGSFASTPAPNSAVSASAGSDPNSPTSSQHSLYSLWCWRSPSVGGHPEARWRHARVHCGQAVSCRRAAGHLALRRLEFALATITLLVVALVGIEQGCWLP